MSTLPLTPDPNSSLSTDQDGPPRPESNATTSGKRHYRCALESSANLA